MKKFLIMFSLLAVCAACSTGSDDGAGSPEDTPEEKPVIDENSPILGTWVFKSGALVNIWEPHNECELYSYSINIKKDCTFECKLPNSKGTTIYNGVWEVKNDHIIFTRNSDSLSTDVKYLFIDKFLYLSIDRDETSQLIPESLVYSNLKTDLSGIWHTLIGITVNDQKRANSFSFNENMTASELSWHYSLGGFTLGANEYTYKINSGNGLLTLNKKNVASSIATSYYYIRVINDIYLGLADNKTGIMSYYTCEDDKILYLDPRSREYSEYLRKKNNEKPIVWK